MIVCPHCRFQLAGPDMPTFIEPGMLCPVCVNDMSAPPVLPISGLQVVVKYLGSILAGATLGVVVILVLTPLIDYLLDPGGPLVGLMVVLGLILMFAVGSYMDTLMNRRVRTQRARWILLTSPFFVCLPFWWGMISYLARNS